MLLPDARFVKHQKIFFQCCLVETLPAILIVEIQGQQLISFPGLLCTIDQIISFKTLEKSSLPWVSLNNSVLWNCLQKFHIQIYHHPPFRRYHIYPLCLLYFFAQVCTGDECLCLLLFCHMRYLLFWMLSTSTSFRIYLPQDPALPLFSRRCNVSSRVLLV